MNFASRLATPVKPIVRHFRRQKTLAALRKQRAECDAFLASYPKSGRTWLRFLLANYFAEIGGSDGVTLRSMFRYLPNFDLDKARGLPAADLAGDRGYPLVAVTHRDYDESLFGGAPVVFLVRDPRDVIVSAYFHATHHKHSFAGSVREFLDDQTYGLGRLIGYLNGWAAGMSGQPHIVLSYEALKADAAGAVAPLLEFLGVSLDRDMLDRAVAAADFEQMSRIEQRQGIPGHDYDRSDPKSRRMRSGKVGGFRDVLSPEEADLIIERCHADLNLPALRFLDATAGAGGSET